jgi:ApaG protein
MSDQVTRGVRVQVESRYHPEQSDPASNYWFFSYTVRITNEAAPTVQLVSRHWIVTDASGHVEQVRGAGVVGQTPVLRLGEAFEYTSACPLPTSLGSMHGSYQMRAEGGDSFDVEIAPFTLEDPATVN